jgi:c-di-GMP-binding flagellar brake protein YcgR
MMERRKHPRVSVRLPLEYCETDDACHGALVGNVSEIGLLIYSIKKIPVGTHLIVRVFFNSGYEFDGFQARARIVWRDHYSEEKWEAYQYGLEFTGIPAEDRHKLVSLLESQISLEYTDAKHQQIT